MVKIRSANEIILNLLDFYRTSQPEANISPGSVIRDLFIEAPAGQISLLYDELSKISNLQALRLAVGSDLDKLAQNFGVSRKAAAKSSGVAIFTFSSIPATVSLSAGELVFSSNGSSFSIANGVSVNPNYLNLYKSVAAKYANDLSFLNITDQYAIEVTVQCTTPGSSGNIDKYAINSTNIVGVSNVTNVIPFTGGTDQEDDATFRNRVLAIFSGSNVGTALGYKNTALSDPSVLDALVIEPGDPLMTRDGSVVTLNSDGSYTIVSEGQGGKVDVIILGTRESEYIDTFIYQDKSNNNDPTDTKNIYVLGQIAADANKTVTRRRIDDINNSTLPAQPVDEVLEVTGSLSGSNFVPKTTDSLGRISGNYELIKDTGIYAGSPFGFDKFHWVSNKISLFEEDRVKGKFCGQDNLTFTDVLEIPQIQQNISIINENSTISNGDRSYLQLLHTPITNVTRVFNVNTGERYTIVNQNPDGNGSVNTTGRIQISGNTLPTSSDVLQVDYTWILNFDPYVDYDGRYLNNNPRSVQDSIDWGIANTVRKEFISFSLDGSGAFYSGLSKHPVNYIVSANVFSRMDGYVSTVSSGNFAGRMAIYLNGIAQDIANIDSIRLQNSNLEVYNTAQNDGVFFSQRVVLGANIVYNYTIILPSDTPVVQNEHVTVIYNVYDSFRVGNINGNFSNNQITIPAANIVSAASLTSPIASIVLDVSYVSNVQNALVNSITNFPISRLGNGFISSSNAGFLNNFVDNVSKIENQVVQKNSLNQLYITLSINSNDYYLSANNVLSAIRLGDGKELWNADNLGTVSQDSNSNYLLIFNGYNSPAVGDKVMIVYYPLDNNRSQPFTFLNSTIRRDISTLQFDYVNSNFYVPFYTLTSQASVQFQLIDPTTGLVVSSGSDGYIVPSLDFSQAVFGSLSFNFGSIINIPSLKLRVMNSSIVNNNAIYDIDGYNSTNNTINILNVLSNLDLSQISIIRVLDGKDLWNSSCSIDFVNRRFIIPNDDVMSAGDEVLVVYFVSRNLRQTPSRLAITTTDQINNSGVITVYGETITKVADVVFTAIYTGLKQNISEAIRTFLSINSNTSIPSNTSLIRVVKLEKVNATTDNQVISVINSFDVQGTQIKNGIYYSNEMIVNNSLDVFDLILPPTENNNTYVPQIGDKLRITFYYSTVGDNEALFFTRNGTLYTNKIFAFIDKAYISSGFTASQSTKFTISYFNQPANGSRYQAFYDYLAPKQNERITIRYNYNKLIGDTTFNIESSRPITADVLVKAATKVLVDITMNIVVKTEFSSSSDVVVQDVKDKITSAINTNVLGDVLNGSDLISVAQGVNGVDRVRIIYFNKDGVTGQVLTITAQKNEYFSANSVIINTESR